MHFVNKMLDKYFDYARILRKLITDIPYSKNKNSSLTKI